MTRLQLIAAITFGSAVLAAPADAGVPLKGVGGKHSTASAKQAGAPLKGVGGKHVAASAKEAGAPLKGVDVKLGKAHNAQAKTKAPAKPAKAAAKGEPHRPIIAH